MIDIGTVVTENRASEVGDLAPVGLSNIRFEIHADLWNSTWKFKKYEYEKNLHNLSFFLVPKLLKSIEKP